MSAPSIKPAPPSPAEVATGPGARDSGLGGPVRQRVLFVDDELAILDGLKAALRPHRHEWDMVFALGGPAALTEIERQTFDVVVTDMRMPVLDGSDLLKHVKRLQPQAIRLVLSGQTDPHTALQSTFTAHQFLAKPCTPEKLRTVIKRCAELDQLLGVGELSALAAGVAVLPAAPTTYLAISRALASPTCDISDVARVVEREPTLCAKVLQLANSAFFGLPRSVSSVTQAATYLGVLTIRDLALAMETFTAAERAERSFAPAVYEQFQLNALAVALLSRRWFAREPRKAADAFVAGMLRDMGHLVAPGAEQHPALSAYLLGLWGIPHSVLEAVARHESPEAFEHEALELVDVVHMADRLLQVAAPSPFQPPGTLDEARLARLGVSPERLREFGQQALSVRDEARDMLRP
jgi:HD-like signal output (HDOD) protein